jgi:hypothetical protein
MPNDIPEWISVADELSLYSYIYALSCTQYGIVMSPACGVCGHLGPGVQVTLHNKLPDPRMPTRVIRATFELRSVMAGLAVRDGWCVTSQKFVCPKCQERWRRCCKGSADVLGDHREYTASR